MVSRNGEYWIWKCLEVWEGNGIAVFKSLKDSSEGSNLGRMTRGQS